MAEKEIIISRMQQRRGNRIDLPQPLRAGEIALASDSKEVFIGLDPEIGVTAQNANVVSVNNIAEGFNYANSYLNNNFVRLIMPSKRFPTGTFNGTTNNTTFIVSGSSGQAHGQPVFNASITTGNIKNVFDSNAFESTDFTGAKNGVALSTNATRTAANLLNNEFFVSSPTSTGQNTTITFGNNPTGTDDITINYYSNVDIINAMFDTGVIGTTSTTGFYEAKSVASFRQFNNAYIRADYEVGTAFIGLEDKHTEVFADSGTVASPAGPLTLSNIILEAAPDLSNPAANVISEISLTPATNLDLVVSTINNDATFRATKVSATTFFIACDNQFQIRFTDSTDATELSLTPNATYTKANNSIKGQLENWIHGSLNDPAFNMFVAAQVGNKFNSGATRISKYTPSTSSENLTLTFTGNQEAENFSTITNKIFGASANADITGLTNIKTNQRLLTQDDYAVLLTGSANSLFEAIPKTCLAGATTDIASFQVSDVDSAIIEYSVRASGGSGNAYTRTGTVHMTGSSILADATLNDTGAVMQNGFGSTTFDLSAVWDGLSNTMKLRATNNLSDGTTRPATFKYLVRKWLG